MQMFLVTVVNQFGEQKAGAYMLDHTNEDVEKNFLNPKDEKKGEKRRAILAQPGHKLVVSHISKGLWMKEHVFTKTGTAEKKPQKK